MKLWCSSERCFNSSQARSLAWNTSCYLPAFTAFFNSLEFALFLIQFGQNWTVTFAVPEYWTRPSVKESHVTCFNIHSTLRKQWERKLIHCQFQGRGHRVITPKIKQSHVSLVTKKSSQRGLKHLFIPSHPHEWCPWERQNCVFIRVKPGQEVNEQSASFWDELLK